MEFKHPRELWAHSAKFGHTVLADGSWTATNATPSKSTATASNATVMPPAPILNPIPPDDDEDDDGDTP